ncbi:CRTAC1 family protein [Cypionkella sp.]|uniref:CRTAC1 family protein n=1 Tax=Cypionkella sp. TaxID=2811411 RepID=UPI0027647504|nr:CRTAC1 family protein [Cypionkella sp.]
MPLIKIKRLAWIATFATLSGAALPAAAEVSFTDRSQALPLRQSYEGEWNHYVGGGVAVLDCNDDGLPDFFAAGGAAPSRLFVNTSGKSGDISFAEHLIASLSEVTGAYPIDIDGDDILDLVVLQDGPNTLLRGAGQCNFTAAPTAWGFQAGSEWTTSFSATFEAGQSWPTLAFGNYVDETNPDGPFEACDKNYLLRPAARSFGPRIPLEPGFCALSMLFSDWQRNGVPDLRVSNDRQYYVRNGREQMWHMTPLAEYTEAEGWPVMKLWGMGIASRDITGDGLPEVVLTSMGDQTLQLNMGKGVMKNAPYATGTYSSVPYNGDDGRASTGWHAEFGDINNDGRDDLFIAKGNVEQMPSNAIHDPNNLLIQQADGSFVEKGGVTGVGTTERSRGAAVVDLNKDGLLDLLVVNRRAPLEIWQNTTAEAGHWLAIDLRDAGPNSRAIGAFVELRLPDGRIQTQEHTVGGGHASGEASPLHFGLGAAEQVELRVIWPDGQTSDWARTATNLILRVSRDARPTLLLAEEP